MSFVRPSEVPYGVFFCRTCCSEQVCDVAAGANRADPDCAIECCTCHERIGEEVDVRHRWPLEPDVSTRQTLTREQRAAGQARARKLALGSLGDELPAPPPAAAPSGFAARAVAEIEQLRGRR